MKLSAEMRDTLEWLAAREGRRLMPIGGDARLYALATWMVEPDGSRRRNRDGTPVTRSRALRTGCRRGLLLPAEDDVEVFQISKRGRSLVVGSTEAAS